MAEGFQYRKRYYPVATVCCIWFLSGMRIVSIPQAVLPSCNDLLDFTTIIFYQFQYRKRYYPVATVGKNYVKFLQSVSIPQAVMPCCNSILGNPLQDWAKMANWKTSPVFSIVASSFGEHVFFLMTFIRFYASIHAGCRIHEKSGKPLF